MGGIIAPVEEKILGSACCRPKYHPSRVFEEKGTLSVVLCGWYPSLSHSAGWVQGQATSRSGGTETPAFGQWWLNCTGLSDAISMTTTCQKRSGPPLPCTRVTPGSGTIFSQKKMGPGYPFFQPPPPPSLTQPIEARSITSTKHNERILLLLRPCRLHPHVRRVPNYSGPGPNRIDGRTWTSCSPCYCLL